MRAALIPREFLPCNACEFQEFYCKFLFRQFHKVLNAQDLFNLGQSPCTLRPICFYIRTKNIELTHTVAHHIKIVFRQTVVLADIQFARSEDLPVEVAFIPRAAKR